LGGLTAATNGVGYSLLRVAPTWRTFGDALRMTGSLLKYTVAQPLINVGKQAIKLSVDFEKSMSLIAGLVGIASDEIKVMGDAILDMAGSVGKAPGELADALYFITSAGITDTTNALDTLDVSARAATAGLGTTKDIADLATSVMNAYSPGLYSAAVATDTLVAAVREGKAEASEFAPAMGKVIPVAAAFGVKFQDVAATMASLTRQGAAAGTSAIYLRQVLNSLLDPTVKAQEKLKEVGLSGEKLRSVIQQEGLLSGLMLLKQGFGDNAEAISQVFGNVRAMTAVFGLLGPNLAANEQIFADLANNAGDTDKAFEKAQETLGYKFSAASAEAKVSLIQLGDSMSPVIKFVAGVIKGFAKFSQVISRNKPLITLAMGIAGLTVTFAALIKTISTFVRLKALSTTIFLALGSGITDQTTGLATNIVAQKQWQAVQYQNIGASAASATATGAATAATATHSAAVAAQSAAYINNNNTILQNIMGLVRLTQAQTGASFASAMLSTGLRTVGRTLLMTIGPMVAITVAFMAFKKLYDMFQNRKKENAVTGLTKDLRTLTDATSTFQAKPILVGVDVRYGGTESNFGAQKADFGEFILPKDEEGKLTEKGERIKEQLDEVTKLTGQARIDAAAAIYAQFAGGDATTADAAAEWFGNTFGLSPATIKETLDASLKDAGSYARLALKRAAGDVDLSVLAQTYTQQATSGFGPNGGGGLAPIDAVTNAVTKFRARLKQSPDLALLGSDAITTQSADLWVASLEAIYSETEKASGSTEVASAVTLEYAKSAITAAGGTTEANDVMGLMKENATLLQGQFGGLNNQLLASAEATGQTTMSMTDYLNEIGKLERNTQGATEAQITFEDQLQSITDEFNEGFVNAVGDAVNLMNAYEGALKSIKEGQDAAYGSQIDLIDAQTGFRDQLRGTMGDLKDSNGAIFSGTSAADASKKSMAELAKSILEVGNATYANTEGDAATRQAAAIAASTKAYQEALLNLKDAGISGADLETFFTETLGKTVAGTKFQFTPDNFALTFGSGDTAISGKLGTDMMAGINKAIQDSNPEISNSISSVLANAILAARDMIQAASPSKKTMNEIGVPMGQGIVAGLKNTKTEVELATQSLLLAALLAAKAEGKIESPSQLFADEVGAPIAQGMAVGISGGVAAMSAAAKSAVSTVYDVLGKGKGGKAINWKKVSQAQMQEYAEGILERKSQVKSSIIQLIDEIMAEVDDQLGKIETSISAKLDFAQANADLAKFQNEQRGFASELTKAQRESTQATQKFGGAGEVTRYERSQIQESAKSAQQAQRDYSLGKISYAALVDSQMEYANKSAEATEMSPDVISAQNSVIDAQFNVTNSSALLAQKQMDVVKSQAALNQAYVNATIAGTAATTTLGGLISQIGTLGTASANIAASMAQSFGMSDSMSKLISGATKQQSNVTINKNKNMKWTPKTSGSKSGRSNVKTETELRAAGGPVAGGMPYVVGELGPELFIPKQGGTIIPTTALERYAPSNKTVGSSSSSREANQINVTINNPEPERASDSIARRVQNMSALGLFG
jgi:TP901 family phage tail tape measure protein